LLVVERAIGSIDGLSRELNDASIVISDVETKATQVNSAIEAARAGEQGRGFAVVAVEVRTLASRTQDSTRDIQTMLEGLQTGVMKAVSAIRASVQTAEGAVKLSSEAGNSLNEINSALIEIKGKSIRIAAAVEEQSAVVALRVYRRTIRAFFYHRMAIPRTQRLRIAHAHATAGLVCIATCAGIFLEETAQRISAATAVAR